MGVQRKVKNCCYIICGGPESFSTVKIPDNAYIICADSGYDKALSAGIKPDLLIGDFDSVKSKLPDDIDVLRAPAHKDDTDTLLAVRTALEKGFDEIILAGACGGRTDHTLANIATLLYIRNTVLKLMLSVMKQMYIFSPMNLYGLKPIFQDTYRCLL